MRARPTGGVRARPTGGGRGVNLLGYILERHRVLRRLAYHHVYRFVCEAGRHRGRPGVPTILFVRRNARSRIYNHALSLKERGYQCILIAQSFDYPFHKEVFSEIHPWYSVTDITRVVGRLIDRYPVKAVIGSLQPAVQTLELLKMDLPVPLLIDHHDSAWSQYYFLDRQRPREHGDHPWLQAGEVEDERACFTGVDGVLARSQELVRLFEATAVPTPIEVFEDCTCEKYFEQVDISDEPRQDEWAVAYAGMAFPMSHEPRYSFPQFVPLGTVFRDERIHFHVFPGQTHEYRYPEYEKEAQRNRYFHMHRSVDFANIRSTLARYDFGLVAFAPPKDYELFSEVHIKTILHAKFHSYLEAGLPIIVSRAFAYEAELVETNGIGIVADTPVGLRERIDAGDIRSMRANVARVREKYLARYQGERLERFIERLADSKGGIRR